ncbi:MAG: ornithine carbamoyltransferase, partial [Clostridium sp.]
GPKALEPDPEVMARVQAVANETGAVIEYSSDISSIKGADAIYSDIWASMGEEHLMAERVSILKDYQVTMDMLKATGNPDVIFMHCLPAFHDMETTVAKSAVDDLGVDIREVTDEVFRSKHSVVFDEAENRMHSIKAILVATLA